MPDLIVYLPSHGYSNGSDTPVFVSWLDANYWTSDEDADSFKLATTSGGATLVQFTETITNGFVREFDDTSGTTTISGLEHLEGETVTVTSEGVIIGTDIVSNGSITISSGVFTYAVGKTYTATLVPMDIDLEGLGLAATTRINRTFVNVHETIGGKIGPDVNHLENIVAGANLFTGFKKVSIPGGYARDTDVVIQQTQPLPMTILGLTHDIGGSKD